MSKRRFIGAATVVLATVALTGVLIASNMGFKLNKALIASTQATPEGGTSLDGTNTIALPNFRQSGLNSASALRTDIGAAAGPVSKFLRSTNSLATYTGARGSAPDFPLESGVGYYVKVNGVVTTPYIVVGSHDPATPITLIASTQNTPEGGTSLDGTNFYSYNYHGTAPSASALRTDIGAAAGPVSKFLRATNSLATYTGARGSAPDFPLVPGEAYFVKVNGTANVQYNASHY